MKKLTLRFRGFFALFLVVGLASCGGYTTVDLGGTITGLTSTGLELVNVGGETTGLIPANTTSYKFSSQIGQFSNYSVSVKTQPAQATGTTPCVVVNATGQATGINITNVNVSCLYNTLGGTISGLTTSGLILSNVYVNGTDTVSPIANATAFTFPNSVPYNTGYAVTVSTQPTGQTCTVTSGTANMGLIPVTTVIVTCV